MKQSLTAENGSACGNTEASKDEIIEKMVIPLIQGTIRYAVFLGLDGDTDDKSEAEGAIFAQAVLPYIDDCDPAAAQVIFDNMKPVAGDASVDFNAVVSAFESTYACLGVDAADIGCYDGRADAGCTGSAVVGASANGSGGSTSTTFTVAIASLVSMLAVMIN